MIFVSHKCKGPLTHFYRFLMKETKTFNEHLKESRKGNNCHMGPTPLSLAVAGRINVLHTELCDLLQLATETDGARWGTALAKLDDEDMDEGRILIV